MLEIAVKNIENHLKTNRVFYIHMKSIAFWSILYDLYEPTSQCKILLLRIVLPVI